ncbi:hypothetical protein Pelo_6998 [Pelomyxa schiedti]|nr:hypothetical protein Pelo_6998 [Pelomyxa schiedti]
MAMHALQRLSVRVTNPLALSNQASSSPLGSPPNSASAQPSLSTGAASGGKLLLGRLPGQPAKKAKPSGTVPAGGPPLTALAPHHTAALMGNRSAYPIFLDLSPAQFNLQSSTFLSDSGNVFKEIDFTGNSLQHMQGFDKLSKLKVLTLTRNAISSTDFRGLNGLEYLSLKINRITTLTDMSSLSKLVNIDLSYNRISGGFEELAKLKNLRVLDLSHNKISMSLPQFYTQVMVHLRNIPRLEYLSFEGNPVENEIRFFQQYILSELPKLRFFNWAPVSKQEVDKAMALDGQNAWGQKLMTATIPSRPTSTTPEEHIQPTPSKTATKEMSNSESLESLLSEIGQMGLLDSSDLKVPPPPQRSRLEVDMGLEALDVDDQLMLSDLLDHLLAGGDPFKDGPYDPHQANATATVPQTPTPNPTLSPTSTPPQTSPRASTTTTPLPSNSIPPPIVTPPQDEIPPPPLSDMPPPPVIAPPVAAPVSTSITPPSLSTMSPLPVAAPTLSFPVALISVHCDQSEVSPRRSTQRSTSREPSTSPMRGRSPSNPIRERSPSNPVREISPSPMKDILSPSPREISPSPMRDVLSTRDRSPSNPIRPTVNAPPPGNTQPPASTQRQSQPSRPTWVVGPAQFVVGEKLGGGATGETYRETPVSYLSMMVEGQSLDKLIATSRSMTPQICLHIAKGIANGMKFLHNNDVVHGLFKPQDVIVDSQYHPRIRDFGLASLKSSNHRDCASFELQYLPTDVFDESWIQMDKLTDVYSYGIVIWELFESGFPPGKKPEPQERPLELSFTYTPSCFVDLIKDCTGQRDSTSTEQALKLEAAIHKLSLLLQSSTEKEKTIALKALQSSKNQTYISSLVNGGLLTHIINTTTCGMDSVVEMALQILIEYAKIKSASRYFIQAGVFSIIGQLYQHQANPILIYVLNLTSLLVKNDALKESLISSYSHNIFQLLKHPDQVVRSNATSVCARLLKSEHGRKELYDQKMIPSLMNLIENDEPVVRLYALPCLACMLGYWVAIPTLLQLGAADRFFQMLHEHSELMQLTGARCASKFTGSAQLLQTIDVPSWITALLHLLGAKNDKIKQHTCSALANLATTEEYADIVESAGGLQLILEFLSTKYEKLLVAALQLLAKLLACASCRDSFRDMDGLSALVSILRSSSSRAPVQSASMQVFYSLSLDDQWIEIIAEAGVIPSFVRQMCAAVHRQKITKLLVTLKLVSALAQGSPLALTPLRDSGCIEQLLDILKNPPQDSVTGTIVFEAGTALTGLLSSEEDRKAIVAYGGMQVTLELLKHPTLAEPLLRKISNICREADMPKLMMEHQGLQHIIGVLSSPVPVMQSLSLKTLLLLAQTKEIKMTLKTMEVKGVLEKVEQVSAVPAIKIAAQHAVKALSL